MSASVAMGRLGDLADELDTLSSALTQVECDLEPIEREYEQFVSNFELGLYQQSIDPGLIKLPSADLRLKLAIQAMPPELYGRYTALISSRKRIDKRMGALKIQVDAQRSILSALKAEMEATR